MALSCENMPNFNSMLREICAQESSHTHLSSLQSLTKALRDAEFRERVEEDVFSCLFMVLSRLFEAIQAMNEADTDASQLCFQMTAEGFRSQRNACVRCPRNQHIIRGLGFIELSVGILSNLITLRGECSLDALRCGIQFLGNIAVGNQPCKDDIWECCMPHIFLDLLDIEDEKSVSYTCMVLHTCLNQQKTEHLVEEPQHFKVAVKVMELCRTFPDIDWTVLLATEHFLKSSALIEKMYAEVDDQERTTLLELISAQLGEGKGDSEDCLLPVRAAQFLASCFHSHCKAVLALANASSSDSEKAVVVIRLLDILCELTSDLREFMVLQDHPDLLQATVELLKEVHLLGKASSNVFSAAQDFPSAGTGGATSTHPVLSFKAHLIRLIGNLCHNHTDNQNKVRELDGIALILDNCSIDSNNPFISQWAVFAIRNILEHNLENQEVVQGLKRQGVADDSMLREMGFRLEERDGNMLLKPLKKDQ